MSNVLVKEMHADMLVYIASLMLLQNTILTVVLPEYLYMDLVIKHICFSTKMHHLKKEPKNVGDST